MGATEPIETIVTALNRHQPEALQSFSSLCARLAHEQLAGRLRIAPSLVVTFSEMRTPEMLEVIRRAWEVEPYEMYATTETGPTASECSEHSGLHVFEDCAILELVDSENRPVAHGQMSDKILVTSLGNRTQPIIRFEITDRLAISDAPCSCGRTFRRLIKIEGRSDDVLDLAAATGGSVQVNPDVFYEALGNLAEVYEYEIVQLEDRLDVRVVPAACAAGSDVAALAEQKLRRSLADVGAAEIPIMVAACESLSRDKCSGKRKLIRALPKPEGRDAAPSIKAR
jgi:phenylacetate-coenzyme A ligase PaaK-like adenylate-forming protein